MTGKPKDRFKSKILRRSFFIIPEEQVFNRRITRQTTTPEKGTLQTKIYFYKAVDNGKTIQSGKLI